MKRLEIAAFNIQSALIAEQNGASRVELCENMSLGGLTPNIDLILQAKPSLKIPIYIMIRPHAVDFVYNEIDFAAMVQSILEIKKIGVDGFVFGILTKENTVSLERNKKLIAAARPLPCTFHRAFDECPVWEKALEDVIACGFNTILTSGFEKNAYLGKSMLKKLKEAAHNRIEILAGGGIRSSNLKTIIEATELSFYHSAAVLEGETASATEIHKLVSILEKYL